MTALSTLINEYLRTNNLSQVDQLGDDERTALRYYIKNKLEGPDVADLLEGLVSPGLMAV